MVPGEFLGLYLIANGVAVLILGLAIVRPGAARWAAVAIFLWASVQNSRTVLTTPEVYLEYAALTPSAIYRDFIAGWFSRHVVAMVLSIAAGQLVVAGLLAAPRPWRLAGVAGALAFLLAIAPLGVGSGFPLSLTFGAAILLADRRLAYAARARAADSPIAAYLAAPDVYERHEVVVRAPAAVVFEEAERFDLLSVPLVRAIFRLRALVMRATPPPSSWAEGLLAETRALGWRELERRPGQLVVMGAVTQPWRGDVVFRGLPPEAFARFAEPNHVRIAWTIAVDPITASRACLRTETAVAATDPAARRRFRRYWLVAGAGILAIRLLILPAMRRRAEHRFAAMRSVGPRPAGV